ncbi:MAG: methyltransferase domain-containing protein [Alphaproteobacteria bacterium]|nr:methyltransferase domain-containing protein [Alphaproteobacteria bacterium]
MPSPVPPALFDRAALRRHIARAAPVFAQHDALFRAMAAIVAERVGDVARRFESALDLSPFACLETGAKIAGVTHAPGALMQDAEILPFAAASADLVASVMALHWVDDLPGVLAQIHAVLKPDGMFIAALPGENTLHELRACLMEAEIAVSGGISPRLSPTLDLQTASILMQRGGFALPVADIETVTVVYPDMFALMRDLRGTGQTNAHSQRPRAATRRAVFFEAARLYRDRFGDANGHIPATIEIINLHGWKQPL